MQFFAKDSCLGPEIIAKKNLVRKEILTRLKTNQFYIVNILDFSKELVH